MLKILRCVFPDPDGYDGSGYSASGSSGCSLPSSPCVNATVVNASQSFFPALGVAVHLAQNLR